MLLRGYIFFVLGLWGCDADKSIPVIEDTGTTIVVDEGCSTDNDCAQGLICENTECIDGDRNNALEEAESLLWEASKSGIINPAGDVDYYTFNAEGGEYIRVYTVSGEDDDTVAVVGGGHR